MDFLAAMQTYLRAERATGWALVGAGLALGIAAVFVWRTQAGGFRTGFVLPLALATAGTLAGGVWLAQRSARQLVELRAGYGEAPEATVEAEAARMEKVNDNWALLKGAWTILIGGALGLIFLGGRGWTTGLGLSLLILATMAMTLDVFAERRARAYTSVLESAT